MQLPADQLSTCRLLCIPRARRKHYFPVTLHINQHPAVLLNLVQCFIQLTSRYMLTVVRKLPRRVGVMYDQAKTGYLCRAPAHSYLEHFAVSVRIPEASDRLPADELRNGDRLCRPVVEQVDLRVNHDHGHAFAHLEMCLECSTDHLRWGYSVCLLGEDPHEVGAAARDDKREKTIGSKIVEDFEHRLIHELREWTPELRMTSGLQPIPHGFLKLHERHARVRKLDDWYDRLHSLGSDRLQIARQQRFEWFARCQLGMLRSFFRGRIERKKELHGKRLFAPQRSIVIENRNASVRRNEIGTSLSRHA